MIGEGGREVKKDSTMIQMNETNDPNDILSSVYTKTTFGPPQVINNPDRGAEVGRDIKEIYFGPDWPNTKTRSLEEFWTGNGA